MIAAILAEQYVDWDAFSKAAEKFGNSAQGLIQKGIQMLAKEHGHLEKPLRDAGIIDNNTKDTSISADGARNYRKLGGKEAMEGDFNRLPGKEESSSDSKVRTKDLPNGDRAVLRNKPSEDGHWTLEIQPGDASQGNRVRVKVRYD